MSQKSPNTAHTHSASQEAHELAEEAMQELQQGHEDEARFVLEEARRIDPEAVEEVVHDQAKTITGEPRRQPARHA